MDNATDRVLRATLVYSFIVGLFLLIPYGIKSHMVTLPLGVIPLFLSAVIGLVGLGNGLKRRAVAIPFDSLLLAFHIGIFVPGVVYLANSGSGYNRYTDAGTVMLGTYATLPLMAAICIHGYCIIRHLPLPGLGTTTCPNCQHEHSVSPHFHFPPRPSTMWAPSTIFTPEDDETETVLTGEHYDEQTVGRPSSDLDGATVIGEPRLNQPLLSESKPSGRLV